MAFCDLTVSLFFLRIIIILTTGSIVVTVTMALNIFTVVDQ
jgi:hypothetical protein